MTTLIITRGLPASGKTTLARAWVQEDPQRRARVNRDDLRAMAHDSVFVSQTTTDPGTERSIQSVRDAVITALLKRGVSVVCDDTALPQRVARDLRRLATLTGSDFEVWDLTFVPLEECLRRNAERTGRALVPADRMREMWTKYVRPLKGAPMPMPEEPDDPVGLKPYVPVPGTPKAVMVDVDGTVALMAGRSPYDETRVHEDRPNLPVIATIRGMVAAGYRVVFCSGRTEACRDATEAWLAEHIWHRNVLLSPLFMRPAGDMRKDSVVKAELFDRHIRSEWDVTCVFDDRDQVVQMWRSLGLTVFQVADGAF